MYALIIVSLFLSVVAFFTVVALCVSSAFGFLKTHAHMQMVDKMFKVSVVSLLVTVAGFVGASFRYLHFSARPHLGIMSDITSIQKVLVKEGLLEGSPCNTLGNETFGAIRAFQVNNRLAESAGAIDEKTLDALFDWPSRPDSPINKYNQQDMHMLLRKPPFADMRVEVSWLQKILTRSKCYEGELDGIFRPELLKAVECFQRSKGITADGVFGPDTLLCAVEEDINHFDFTRPVRVAFPAGENPANADSRPDRDLKSASLRTDKRDCLCSTPLSALPNE